MRLAFLTDIHGNLPALEAVLADIRAAGVDAVAVGGDLADRGPFARECVHCVATLDALVVLGNTDRLLLDLQDGCAPVAHYARNQFAPMRWTHAQLDDAALRFLRSLPEQQALAPPGTAAVRLVHGSPCRIDEGIFPDRAPQHAAGLLESIAEPVLLCGHTHRPWALEDAGRLGVNAGSVGQPFSGDPRAQYAILAWDAAATRWRAELRGVHYDKSTLRQAFRSSGYLAAAGAFGYAAMLSSVHGDDYITPFLHHAYRIAADAGVEDGGHLPDGLLERAAATWSWRPLPYP